MAYEACSASTNDTEKDAQLIKELEESILLSLPPTIDRTRHPRTTSTKVITMCVLGSSKQYLDLLLEGGACCQGSMMLVVSPSWLEKASTPTESPLLVEDASSRIQLMVHKAIVFYKGGQTYLDVFLPPRRVTYFINGMPDAFDASGVDCAMNGSQCLSQALRDSLFWKIEMFKKGALIPPGLLLCLEPSLVPAVESAALGKNTMHETTAHETGGTKPSLEEMSFKERLKEVTCVEVVELSLMEDREDLVVESLLAFLPAEECVSAKFQIVVTKKLQGQYFTNLVLNQAYAEIIKVIVGDVDKLRTDDYIYIEAIEAIGLGHRESRVFMSGKNENFIHVSAHVTVCRGLDDQPLLSEIYGSVSPPTTSDAVPVYYTLGTILRDLGISDPSHVEALTREIKRQTRSVMDKVVNMAKCYHGLDIRLLTDFLEIGFTIGKTRGVRTPVLQEVRNHHTNLDMMDAENMIRPLDNSARCILHVMVQQSHAVLLRDKCIVVLTANLKGHQDLWVEAQKFGVKIIIVTPTANEDMEEVVKTVIVYDFTDGTKDSQHAENILDLLKERKHQISGCVSRQCKFSMLAAMIRQNIGARGPTPEACHIAYEKYLTHTTLMNSSARRFTNKAVRVDNMEEMKTAVKEIDFPAFLKFDTGAGAVGAAMVANEEACLSHYQNLLDEMKTNRDVFEIHSSKSSVILTKYVEGTEHTVDIVVFDARLVASFVRDVAEPTPAVFLSTSHAMPSSLPVDKRNTLVRAAAEVCFGIGLRDGILNVDIKLTPEGPKLLEINGRFGGYLTVPLFKQIYDENVVMITYLINCGIRPTIIKMQPSRKSYTLFLRSPQHCDQLNNPWVLERLKNICADGMIMYESVRDYRMTTCDTIVACIGAADEDGDKAKQALLVVAKTLGFDTPAFDCAYILDHS